jgi:predicted RNA-binding Zn-ribbon protein involved in translation (DUF1610 family)
MRMKEKYVTVRCPACGSVSQLKATGVRTDFFYCPICLDGEISYREQPSRIYRTSAESRVAIRELVAV